ncbi:ATP-binding protein [Streptomyces sp. NPDC050504]|uniref:sensor histidine kinase n=1 Tax=Streptomyces sp. NPDC050504 TaxID=3365618 RepID=UPI00379516BF
MPGAQGPLSQEQLRLLTATLEAMPEGALIVSPDLRVVAVNRRFTQLFGLDGAVDTSYGAPTDPLVAHLVAHHLPHSGEMVELYRQSLKRTATARSQVSRLAEYRVRDGRMLRRHLSPVRLGGAPDGTLLGHLWLLEDITDRQAYEDELRHHAGVLGDLARERATFTARTLHELRTPLATVLSFCDLLLDPATGPLTTDQSDFLTAIHRNARRLRDALDGLLHTFADDHARPLAVFAPFSVPALVTRVALHALGRSAGSPAPFVSVSCEEGPEPVGDEDLLEDAVTALVSNAVKYTPRDGSVEITARPLPTGQWEVVVADDGIGIPVEFQETVFEPFVRASNARRSEYPGTGLGLSTAQDAVRLHGGSLCVRSKEGVGSVFTMRLPFSAAVPAEAREPRRSRERREPRESRDSTA